MTLEALPSLPPTLSPDQNALIEAHRYLAIDIAVSYWSRAKGAIDRHDAISIAYQGLVKAAQEFDPDWRPVETPRFGEYDPALAFGSYAKRKINYAILDWLRVEDHATRRERADYKDLVENGHGMGASPEHLADITGLPVDKIRVVVAAVEGKALSLDDEYTAPYTRPHDDYEENVFVADLVAKVVEALIEFSPEKRSIVVLSFYHGKTSRAISEELGVPIVRVRLLLAEGLADIHDIMTKMAR